MPGNSSKCTLCNEINVAMNNIGHEVINNAKTFSRREAGAKCTLCNEINAATNKKSPGDVSGALQ